MFAANVLCQPWDLEDEGIDCVLDRLQGELGASGITVRASGPPVRQLRRHASVEPRVFQTLGGLYFQPDADKYGATRIKPVVADWVKSRNPLSKIADACGKRGLQFRAAVYTRRLECIVSRHPEFAVKSCFGDVSPGRMCQHNPDAAEFFRAMVADLSAYEAAVAVELCDLDQPFETDLLDAAAAENLGSAGSELFGVCFCESCLQAAGVGGVDTESAHRSAQVTLLRGFESGEPLEGNLDEHAPLQDFIRNRCDAHAAFIESIRAHAESNVALHIPADRIGSATVGVSACDAIIADIVTYESDRLLSPFDGAHFDVRREVQAKVRVPAGGDAALLIKTLNQLSDQGLDGITLDHYAEMGDAEFTAAKQAIRYARRTATA